MYANIKGMPVPFKLEMQPEASAIPRVRVTVNLAGGQQYQASFALATVRDLAEQLLVAADQAEAASRKSAGVR